MLACWLSWKQHCSKVVFVGSQIHARVTWAAYVAHIWAKQTEKVAYYLASQAGICKGSLSGTLLLLDGFCMLGDSSLHQDNLLNKPNF